MDLSWLATLTNQSGEIHQGEWQSLLAEEVDHVTVGSPQKREAETIVRICRYIISSDGWYLDNVNTLPKVNKRENFLGLINNSGRKETARPKQIVPAT